MANGTKILCDHCNTPVAEIVGDVLVITVKHHREKHTTVLALKDLRKLLVDTVKQE